MCVRLGGAVFVRKPVKLVLKVLFENIHMILYREARDFCKGFYRNPRWFLMRKIGRFESVKALVGFCRQHVRGMPPSLLASDHQQTLLRSWISIGHSMRWSGTAYALE